MIEATVGRFGDKRLACVGGKLAGAMQRKHTFCLHRLGDTRAETRQFSHFLANPAVSSDEMLATAARQTNQRAAGRHVLAIMDTTDLRFPTHEKSKRGFGRDGTEYHCSDKIHCPNCSHRKRGKSGTEYFHAMLAATIVAPGHNRAIPLEPEFVVPRDGHDKQDCESRAVRRWLAAHGPRHARLRPVYLGDDLFSRQPICQAVLETGGHFLFVRKPESHKAIEEFGAGIVPDALTQRVRRGKQWVTHDYRWLSGVPLRGDVKAIAVSKPRTGELAALVGVENLRLAMPGQRQVMAPADHRLAPGRPALPSAPDKKSFSSVSSPILAWSVFTSTAG